MRIRFGLILKITERTKSIPSIYRSPACNTQHARCLLKGLSLQEPTEIIQLIKYPSTLFNLSYSLEGCDPRFSKTRFAPISSLFGELDDGAPDAFAVLHFAFHPVTLSIRQTEGVVPP